jgi:hypothetical protein
MRPGLLILMGSLAVGCAARSVARAQDQYEAFTVPKSELRIDRILDSPMRTPVAYADAPLSIIMAAWEEEYGIPFRVDFDALEAVTASADDKVSLRIGGVSLRSALELLLMQVEDLDFIIRDEALVLTTDDEARSYLVARVYRVDDLKELTSDSQTGGASARADYDPLLGATTACVDPVSWKDNATGPGVVKRPRPGIYVILQTQRVHRKIKQFLADLRACKAAIEKDAPSGGEDNPFAGL